MTGLAVDGELTIISAAEQHERLQRWLGSPEAGPDPVLDLAGVAELDTAGLQVLLLAREEARRRGLRLRLTGHTPAVLDVLATAWLTPELEAAG